MNNFDFKSKSKFPFLIGLVLLAVYSLFVFVITGFEHGASFWISYGFIFFAIFVMLVSVKSYNSKKKNKNRAFVLIPVKKYATAYVAVQVILSTIIMFVEYSGTEINLLVALLIHITVAALFLIVLFKCFEKRDVIEAVANEVEEDTEYFKLLRVDVKFIAAACKNEEFKPKLEKFAEDVRMSDPVSDKQLRGLEKDLHKKINSIKHHVEKEKYDKVAEELVEAKAILAERNEKCKLFK